MTAHRRRSTAGASGWRSRGAGLAALLLSACGSVPAPQLYSLRPEAAAPQAGAVAAAGIAVGPVTLPALLDRPQWVLQQGANQVRVLEQQRWAQPLQADIAQSTAAHLSQLLGELAYADGGPGAAAWPVAPRLRVQIDVLRFESRLEPSAAIDDEYRWAVSCVAAARQMPARAGLSAVVGAAAAASGQAASAYEALAQAHARGLRQVSEEIAAALRELAASCPGT